MAFKAGSIYGEAFLDTKKWNSGLSGLSKGVGIALAAVAAAAVAYMAKAVKAADEFQRAMSNVSTLVDTSVISMQSLSREILLLDPRLGSATDLTNGLYQAFSAGAETAEEAMKITADAAKFGKAALTDTNTAVDVLTTAINAYGKEVMTSTKASDIFFETIKLGKVTGEELASTIGSSIPLFASAGISLEELSAGIAAMTKQGVNSAVATTQLNAIVSAFLKPSEDMIKALEGMGYASGSAFLEAEGLAGALKLVENYTRGDAAEMAKLLPNIRALRGAMALTGVGGETFVDTLESLEKATGATDVAFQKQELTFETFKNSAGKLQTVIGNIGKHFVDQIAVGATTATQSMLGFILSSDGMNLAANVAGKLDGGFSGVKSVITPLAEAIKEHIGGVWKQLKESLTGIFNKTGESGGAFKALAFAVNLVVMGIHILSGVIIMTIQAIGDLIVAIKESGGVIGDFFAFLAGKKKWDDVKAQAKVAGDAFKNLGEGVAVNIGDMFKNVREDIRKFSGETEVLAGSMEASYKIAVTNMTETTKNVWGELTTGFIDGVLDGMNQFNLQLADSVSETEDYIKPSDDIVLEWHDKFGAITEAFGTFHSGLTTATTQFYTNQQALLDLSNQKELASLKASFESGKITQEEYDEKRTEIEKDGLKKRNALGEKQFKADKLNQIAGVWIDTAGAIQGYWANSAKLGPVAGPIFAGIMTGIVTASGIAQSALIAGQKFVPAMAGGGTASGMTRVNERGGEVINLPDGSLVIPNDISRQIASSSGKGNVINVSFDGAKISDEMDLDMVAESVARKISAQMRIAG